MLRDFPTMSRKIWKKIRKNSYYQLSFCKQKTFELGMMKWIVFFFFRQCIIYLFFLFEETPPPENAFCGPR